MSKVMPAKTPPLGEMKWLFKAQTSLPDRDKCNVLEDDTRRLPLALSHSKDAFLTRRSCSHPSVPTLSVACSRIGTKWCASNVQSQHCSA